MTDVGQLEVQRRGASFPAEDVISRLTGAAKRCLVFHCCFFAVFLAVSLRFHNKCAEDSFLKSLWLLQLEKKTFSG